ncbi:MAG: signal peptidase I [Candidatus Bathyarchaeia archaeon]
MPRNLLEWGHGLGLAPSRARKEVLRSLLLVAIALLASYAGWIALGFALRSEYPLMVVVGGSMLPTYQEGDLVVVQGVSPREIAVGDIIVFKSPPHLADNAIIHRVIGIVERDGKRYFVTKGDNNPAPDRFDPLPGIPEDYVIGRVVAQAPRIGLLALWLKKPIGMAIMLLFVILALAFDVRSKRSK